MIHEKITLHQDFPEAELITYIADDTSELKMPPRPAILILPGGGYSFLSDREGEPVAKAFLAAGFNAAILKYGVGEFAKFPRPLIQTSLAMKYLRDNAEKFNIDPDRIFVIGFSAGGHLAASLGTLWHNSDLFSGYDIPYGSNRPSGMVLSYPVISSGTFAHSKSFRNLLGNPNPTEEELNRYSIEYLVDERTVPAFIWHTFTDKSVPVENALLMANALRRHNIPFELHVFTDGPHGLSLATEQTCSAKESYINPHAAHWLTLCIEWLLSL
ncbi:MAG: alpha/beta hydrolase [Clostridiales bacterium]|nr:alpha/beta hydrolase [Clostridiales bacterium]